MDTWRLAAAAAATVALIACAAKTHGRQIRLERERHGVWQVDFAARNDPWVEGLWRRDRLLFWWSFPVLALSLAALAFLLSYTQIPGWWAFAAGLALGGAFMVAGLASSARLLRDMRQGVPSPQWRAAGHRGSLLWWSATAGLSLACAALLLWP